MEDKINKNQGEIAIFMSSKGGVGKTVLAVNVAAELTSRGCSTCILDGDFQFGDVNFALDIQPRYTISDIVLKEEVLEDFNISDYLSKHDSGLKVLSAPLKPELADLITAPMIPALCGNILKDNKYLIVDLATGFSEINLSFMELADLIFVVTDLDLCALKNTKILLKTLNKLEMGRKVKVIVNRSDSETLTKASQVPDMLEINEVLYITDNYKVVSKSLNIGIPFVISKKKEKITSDILAVTREFNVEGSPVLKRKKSNRRGLIGVFSR